MKPKSRCEQIKFFKGPIRSGLRRSLAISSSSSPIPPLWFPVDATVKDDTNPTANDGATTTPTNYAINRKPSEYSITLDPASPYLNLINVDKTNLVVSLRSNSSVTWSGKAPFTVSFKATSGGQYKSSIGNARIDWSRIYANRESLIPALNSYFVAQLRDSVNGDYGVQMDADGKFTDQQETNAKSELSIITANKLTQAVLETEAVLNLSDKMPQSSNYTVAYGLAYNVYLSYYLTKNSVVDINGGLGFSGLFGEGTGFQDISPNPYTFGQAAFEPITVLGIDFRLVARAQWNGSSQTADYTVHVDIWLQQPPR